MRVSTFATVVCLAMASAAAQAQVTIESGPGNFFGDENVLFNDSTLIQQGFQVQGHTNQNNFIVDFFSNTELEANGGQAKIDGLNGGTFSDLSLSMNDSNLWINTLIWNLNAVEDGNVTFTVNHSGGVWTETFALDKSGQNFFRISADSDIQISSVSFLADVGLRDVKQVRLGAVPEPATLVGLGLGAVALLRRRKKATK